MVTLLVVQARGRVNGLRDPVDHHIREELVFAVGASEVTAAVTPSAELFDNPSAEPNRRVVEAVRQSLRLGPLNTLVPGFLLSPGFHFFQPGLLCRGQVLTMSGMGSNANHIEVNTNHILRIGKA